MDEFLAWSRRNAGGGAAVPGRPVPVPDWLNADQRIIDLDQEMADRAAATRSRGVGVPYLPPYAQQPADPMGVVPDDVDDWGFEWDPPSAVAASSSGTRMSGRR